jgi:hypothetical protein
MADVDGILQVQRIGQRGDIGDIGVHVMPRRALGRAAMATAVMGDDAIAFRQEEHHLRVPVVAGERPAVVEDDGLGVLAPQSL